MTYAEKLQDSRWQAKRLKILERDDYECQRCHIDTDVLQVHHLQYREGYPDPWNYDNDDLITLCQPCHELVGTKTSKEEIVNPWWGYERAKKDLPKLPAREYGMAVRTLSNNLSL